MVEFQECLTPARAKQWDFESPGGRYTGEEVGRAAETISSMRRGLGTREQAFWGQARV